MVIKLDGERDLSGQLLAESKPIYSTSTSIPQILKGHAEVDLNNIKETVKDLENMGTRHHKSESGIKVPGFLKERYEALAKGRSDVTIDFFKNQNSPQDNIRVRILGKTKPDEVVLIGSHIDSINQRGGLAPGADDNASGTATNLEVFRVLMKSGWTFDRTIEIHGYGAEEVGLYGSANMAKDYSQRKVNVVSMVQFDMNLFQTSKDLIMWFVSNDTDASFNKELQEMVTQYQKLPVAEKSVFGGTSDHRSWTSRGFKAAFPFEDASSYNTKIHTTGDTSEYSGNFRLAAEFAKLGLSYFAHYAGKI
jgi:leucyl aminopeptidase